MRRLPVVLLLAASVTVAAQQAPPVFRSAVSLVVVDATVLDGDGRPVPGLSAADFEIKLNGKVQPIRTMSYLRVEAPAGLAEPAATPPPAVTGLRSVATNAVPADERKILLVMVDDMSFPAGGGMRTLAAARTFIARLPPTVLLGVTTTSGAVVVNPTLDRAVVESGLRRIVGQFVDPRRASSPANPSVGITEAIEIAHYNNTSARDTAITRECLDGGRAMQTGEYGIGSNAIGLYNTKCATDLMSAARLIASQTTGSTSRQIRSITDAVQALHGAPGLKQMIVVTQGIATTRELSTVFRPITSAAAAAGVQLTVLMEDEDDNDAANQARVTSEAFGQRLSDTGLTSRRREDRRMFSNALQALADIAGGTFERIVTNPAGAFNRAAIAGSAVYRLGVEAPGDASPAAPIEVSAVVKRAGVSIHANRHAVLPDAVPSMSAAERVDAAITRGSPFFAVPLRVGVTRRQADSEQVELSVGLAVPAAVPGPLKVTIGVLSAAGALKRGVRVLPAPETGADYSLTVPMPIAPGPYRLRLAVEDANGRVGSVDTEVDGRLTPMGPMLASDLLTWSTGANGQREFFTLDALPAGLQQLGAGLELYRAAGESFPPDVRVALTILSEDGTPVATIDLTPRVTNDRLRAEASLPVAALPAGVYVIRATVLARGERLGEVAVRLRRQ